MWSAQRAEARIYISALTPGDKVVQFFDKLLDDSNAGKPLMRPYLKSYFDLYWDLHLGVKGDAVPARVREIGEAFNTVLAYRDVTKKIVYENYMTVRSHLAYLKEWIDDRLADLASGKTPNPEKTFAHYWIKNAELRAQGCRVRGVSQFRGAKPMGQHDVQHHAQAGQRHRRRRAPGSRRPWKEALTTPAATPSHHLSASSWSCSAPSRRTAEAYRPWPK